MRKKGKNSNNKNIAVELGQDLIARIDHLIDGTGQFKSRDDFIELACLEFVVRRNPAAELQG